MGILCTRPRILCRIVVWFVIKYSSILCYVLNPRVVHTMDVHSPFISVLCHFDWIFHGESCPRLDVVHSGSALSFSPAQGWFYLGIVGAIRPNFGLASEYDIKHCMTNSKHRHIGAKRSVLWPAKYAKMRTPLGSSRLSPDPLVHRGGNTALHTPPHSAPLVPQFGKGTNPNVFVYNRLCTCVHLALFLALSVAPGNFPSFSHGVTIVS